MERVGDASSFGDKHELPVEVDLLCSGTVARPPAASGREGKGFKQLIQALWVSPLLPLDPEMSSLCAVSLPRTAPQSHQGLCHPWEHLSGHLPCFWASEDAGLGRGHGQGSRTPMDHTRSSMERRMERAGQHCPASTVRSLQCHTMSPVPWHVQDGATAHTALQPLLNPDVAALPGTSPASCSFSFPG